MAPLATAWRRLAARWRPGPQAAALIPDALWHATVAALPFIASRPAPEGERLRALAAQFLARKRFHGAHGFVVTDAMALSIAAQACLPLVHLGPNPLTWYDDFVTIVMHENAVLARREATDAAGVVHRWHEPVIGEAMDRGPVMLSWHDVAAAAERMAAGTNVVIHEFAHKLDLRDGAADGCPPLPKGFAGARSVGAARAAWFGVFTPSYEDFREQVIVAERFGGEAPWLDAYGATSPAEFWCVACEAYFVASQRFRSEFPRLARSFDDYFTPACAG